MKIEVEISRWNSLGGITEAQINGEVNYERMLALIEHYKDDPNLIEINIRVIPGIKPEMIFTNEKGN